MADLDDHEEDDSNMSNVVESDQGGSDSGAGATPALPMGAREKQRKMLANRSCGCSCRGRRRVGVDDILERTRAASDLM